AGTGGAGGPGGGGAAGSGTASAAATALSTAGGGEINVDSRRRFGEIHHHHHSDALALQVIDHIHQPSRLETVAAARIRHSGDAAAAHEFVEERPLFVSESFGDLRQIIVGYR